MASYWEVDSVQISPLANSLYPQFTGTWEYISPSGSTASDGDEHFNMALDASNTGATGGNAGESPIVAEIINAASTVGLIPSGNQHAKTRGIFRYYHEHAGELKYEIHPMTEVYSLPSNTLLKDCRPSFKPVADATTKALSTYTDMAQGNNQTVNALVMADNNRVIITYPTGAGADTVNYLQYDGQVVQTLTNDFVSSYITFRPTNSPAGLIAAGRVMRCRIVTNTIAARIAVGLISNQTVTVNILNRVDMLGISNIVASMTANQSLNFVQPIE